MVLSVAVMLALLLDCKGSFAEALAAIVCFLGSKRRERRERESGRDTEMVSFGENGTQKWEVLNI